jgi:hypothetical protein
MSILDIQRRYTEIARARAGERNAKGQPQSRSTWRFTTPHQAVADAIAELYGGKVESWEKQLEVNTDASSIPVYVPPQTTEPWYELWTAGGLQRRCDGVTKVNDDQPCVCDPEDRDCKPTFRFIVMLRELSYLGAVMVQSHGWNAVSELSSLFRDLSGAMDTSRYVEADLVIETRKNSDQRPFPVIQLSVDLGESLESLVGAVPRESQQALHRSGRPVTSDPPPVAPLPTPIPVIPEVEAPPVEVPDRPHRVPPTELDENLVPPFPDSPAIAPPGELAKLLDDGVEMSMTKDTLEVKVRQMFRLAHQEGIWAGESPDRLLHAALEKYLPGTKHLTDLKKAEMYVFASNALVAISGEPQSS